MRNPEYYIELRLEAHELKTALLKEFREILDRRKEPNMTFTSDEMRKEYSAEQQKQLSKLRTKIDILSGQITVFNNILNYDTPITLGENRDYKL